MNTELQRMRGSLPGTFQVSPAASPPHPNAQSNSSEQAMLGGLLLPRISLMQRCYYISPALIHTVIPKVMFLNLGFAYPKNPHVQKFKAENWTPIREGVMHKRKVI